MSIKVQGPSQGNFTPSDLVFLEHAPWKRDLEDNRSLKPGSVLRKSDFHLVLVSAFLANERYGSIRLELSDSRLLGLTKITTISSKNVGPLQPWPASSLESSFQRSGEVPDIVADLIGKQRHISPEDEVVQRMIQSQVKRGLLERGSESKRFLGILPHARKLYELPRATKQALDGEPGSRARMLLVESKRESSALYEALVENVRRGFLRRTDTASNFVE